MELHHANFNISIWSTAAYLYIKTINRDTYKASTLNMNNLQIQFSADHDPQHKQMFIFPPRRQYNILLPLCTGTAGACISLHGQRLTPVTSAADWLDGVGHSLYGTRVAASHTVWMHTEVSQHTNKEPGLKIYEISLLAASHLICVTVRFFCLSWVQVLWDHIWGAELSEKDGGESEAIEASQEGCERDFFGWSKRRTDRRQQDPTTTGTGCGIPGRTGRWRLKHADQLLPGSVTNISIIWLLTILSYTALCCCVSQIQKMGLQQSDISMFSTLMDLVKEARELAEQ